MSKGSKPRPVNKAKFDKNFERIFKKDLCLSCKYFCWHDNEQDVKQCLNVEKATFIISTKKYHCRLYKKDY